MTISSHHPSHIEMESLFVNNEELERISDYLNRFNPIRVMRMERQEIRHSAILSWLLDPKETHGLGDRFLKAFLTEAFRGHSKLNNCPTALEILQSDLRDIEIRREWKNIDIFIYSPINKWVFIIENKYYSKQHGNQLSRYMNDVHAVFGKEVLVGGIFLTLRDEEPDHPNYAPLGYDFICKFLSRLSSQDGLAITQEVSIFLRHYLEIIRDEVGMSNEEDEMKKLARQLYRSHKKVLDFVNEHGAATDFVIAAESLFKKPIKEGEIVKVDQDNYVLSVHNDRRCSFLPECWYRAFGEKKYSWPGCEEWWAGYPLICWLELMEEYDGVKGKLRLFAEVGPISDQTFRKNLINEIKEVARCSNLENVQFQQGAENEGRQYSKFFKNNTVDIQDIQNVDEIVNAIKKLLSEFRKYFVGIGNILDKYSKYGKVSGE